MNFEHETIINKVREYMESSFAYEIYDITYKHINGQMVLEITIDSPEGIKVSDCELVSNALGDYLDETDLIKCEYVLEVASPGVERLLKRSVDYERHIEKLIKFKVCNPETGRAEVIQGRLKQYSPSLIKVQTGKKLLEFSLSDIDKVQAVFEFPIKQKCE